MKNQSWASYVKEKRKTRRLTSRKLAEIAKIDPSYITLIERDGYIPRKDKVIDIGKALEVDENQILIMAGYAPLGVHAKDLIQRMEYIKFEESFEEEMLAVIKEINKLNPRKQKQVAQMLTAYVKVIKEEI